MGKRTIAEFVGDQDSVDVLTQLGVDYGQGYFLGRPEPLAEHLAREPRITRTADSNHAPSAARAGAGRNPTRGAAQRARPALT